MADYDRADMVATFRRLAILAGDAIMEVYGRDDFDVRAKSDDSPVTQADEAADRVISAGLRAAFEKIPLVTEEQSETHNQSVSTFIIVDPLDGTKEFVQRRGDFTVNIALVEDGVPTLGVVFAPAKGRLFYTAATGGSVEETGEFAKDTPGPVTRLCVGAPDNTALRVVASKSHRSPELESYIDRYNVADSVAAGSSLKFCLVAVGEADFYPRLGPTMEWDTAAGDAVLRGAGGEVVDRSTLKSLRYGKADFRNPHFLAYSRGVDLKPE
ncbi:3'(2'),5'-bisphosphate nucleotidase CysQ [Boseongicola aestuarii]|uniref:3'(2'),5'-bisphosphate nucleotidase CysQ n=1 Tax=Boseongicola aestuarii TaxID=1470561 RepID=A0A238J4T5_9RHOB|nr:3'(2'),5'-bisphosphate nucleotidase CysQ [Boseongicola aestuarii]SMX24914.1 3'(2'),5'-bisphosphate nucleotidase CysQ [Boseongicola aestuarii]